MSSIIMGIIAHHIHRSHLYSREDYIRYASGTCALGVILEACLPQWYIMGRGTEFRTGIMLGQDNYGRLLGVGDSELDCEGWVGF